MDFDWNRLVGLRNGRDEFGTREVGMGCWASGPSAVGLEVKIKVGAHFHREFNPHVCVRMETGGDTAQKKRHMSDVFARDPAHHLI
jgi:hypothetical protein